MKGLPSIAPLASVLARQDATASGTIDRNAAPPNLSTLANNTLFETWRPRAHVLPPTNHVGDPCMHYTDPETGLFHVGYLYSNDDVSGAAGATTDDFVHYRDVKPDVPVFIEPGGKNDPVAVFDGSVIPRGINGTPTLFYTSVSFLPIHWTIPYTKGAETASLAVTYGNGSNFTKVNHGPSIPGPPYGSNALNVTGFRDPYVFQSPRLDALLDSNEGVWYNVISGGVHNVSATQFLYRQVDPEFRDWEYLGQWWSEEPNSTWGDGTWAGRWGFNMEVANIFTVDETGYDYDGDLFITLGTEWGYAPVEPQTSPQRNMLWASGTLSKNETQRGWGHDSWGAWGHGKDDDSDVKFQPNMAGFLDWGTSSYAAAGKYLPASSQASQQSGAEDRFISYIWITSNHFGDLDFPDDQQGWDGSLATPRELTRGTISNVVDNELVHETASWRVDSKSRVGDTVELVTLHQKIVREAWDAYTQNATNTITQAGRTIEQSSQSNTVAFDKSPSSKFFVMTASINFTEQARGNNSDVKAGFKILSSEHEETIIYYQFSNETLIIDRSNSSAAALTTNGIATNNEVGKLRLFDIQCEGEPEAHVETLDLTILVDNGIVEVYANDRFVISTWVWSWYAASNNIAFFHEGSQAVKFGDVQIYEGLADAWPERSR
ncbi:hypothetical protein NU195Hw_g2427t1 [Hortaea werneckii]